MDFKVVGQDAENAKRLLDNTVFIQQKRLYPTNGFIQQIVLRQYPTTFFDC